MLKVHAEANLPTDFGNFKILAFSESASDWMPHIVLVAENTDFSKPVNVRFHSECLTGEVFHSTKCECGQQLDAAMQYMQDHGGLIIYLRQEGRNIGIINKIKAYALQEQGFDTVEANLELGLPADDRNFGIAIEILNYLEVKAINLLTNNPDKLNFVKNSDIKLVERIPLQMPSNTQSERYLQTKKDFFGHLLDE